MIAARLGEPNVQALGQKLGTDRNQTLMAVAHSFPVLLKGMAQNASQKEGAFALAGALDRDHDGSLLANVGQAIQNPAGYKGSGIVNHIFGAVFSHFSALFSRFLIFIGIFSLEKRV